MYEVKRKVYEIDGTEIPLYERDVYDHNVLTVQAGTAGYNTPGAEKTSTKTVFSIRDNGCTNWDIATTQDGILVTMRGDSELVTMIKALEFILRVLKDEKDGVHD